MAAVLEREPQARAPERIRHPLQTVRATIRRYVLSEGAALAVSFLALWFWIGLALDWGLFAALSFDWVQELQNIDETQRVAFYVRLVILLALVGCLAALVISKMVMRLTREFSDAAVALVLERRFPRELGDRLITAVEMADAKQAAVLGFSQAMIEKTIQEAGERVDKLPVAEVFDWRRLRRQWLLAGLLTIGVFVGVGVVTGGVGTAIGALESPVDFFGRFGDAAMIWTERNVLLQNSYWPRHAYLEIIRFQDTPSHRGEMRVGRDEQRPDLIVRAVEWVVADRQVPDGWRPLRWNDLPNYVDKAVLDKVSIPADYPGWTIDLDDLDPDVPASALPATWQGKTAGDARAELRTGKLAALQQGAVAKAVEDLLDWHTWTVDKLAVQTEKDEVRRPLREAHQESFKALEDVFGRLEQLAASSGMSRRVRKLTIPKSVEIVYRGETTRTTNTTGIGLDRKFAVDLNEMKESGRFRVRGADYWTRPLRITLVPPPSVIAVTVDKEEPAYLYHRLVGKQAPLQGKKQLFKDFAVSATGETTTIDIPLGSNMTLHAKHDRHLKEGIFIRAPGGVLKEAGAVVPDRPVTRDQDGTGYQVRFENITKLLEFNVEYQDEDNVKGKRRYRIRPIDDQPPEIISAELAAVLRKPRFKADPGKASGGLSIEGYLITPDALVPFLGTLRDDYGLAKAEWAFETEMIDIQLANAENTGAPGKDRSALILLQGNPRLRRAGLIASGLSLNPAGLQPGASTAYWGWVTSLFQTAAKHQAKAGEESAGMEGFAKRLDELSIHDVPLADLEQKLNERPAARQRLKEYQLKDESGFDVRRHLARIKTKDPVKEPQQLHFLRLWISATDNNLETGPSTSRTKAPFFFLAISENDLLAQIAMEEEVLGERIEKSIDKLAAAKVSVIEQTAKLPAATDLSLVAIRADEVRKTVLDTASVTREVQADFARILRELEVNRCRQVKIDEVRTKIVQPLEEIVNPNFGEFQGAEEAAQKFYQALDDDATAKRSPNVNLHLANAKETREQLEKLIDRLNQVSIAITEGITEARNRENLILISRNQDAIERAITTYLKRRLEDIFNELTEPPQKK